MNPRRIITGIVLMTRAVIAGTSANYTLAPDTVDSGGLRGTSANYALNGSAMPGGAGNSTSYTARTGFGGQISDAIATAIEITAAPLTVNEGSTRQLSAILLYDDSSSTPLAAGSVTWSVLSGPLAGISAAGLVTASTVYQDASAVVRGAYQTFTDTLNLTVVNTLTDNFGTYAGDAIPDYWQVLYFGIGNPRAGPLMDPDGDGWDNRFEYNACLIPTNPLSVFSMSITGAAGGGHAVRFSPRMAECTYILMGSNDLSLWTPVTGTVTDAGVERTILDPAGTGSRRFYYMSVQRP